MSNRTRNIVIIGFVAITLALVVYMSWSAASTTNDLSASLRRRSPVTDYMTAEFGHSNCRKNLEDTFLAHVADAITIEDMAARQAAIAAIKADAKDLRKLEELCPTPAAPMFNDDGELNGYTTTTTTTVSG